MFGKWGIMGYVVFFVIIWGLVIDFLFGKLKYFMNLMYVYKCVFLIKWYFKMLYILLKKKFN